jgi:hypothetical protein
MQKKSPDINFLDLTPITKVNFEKNIDDTIFLLIPKFKNKLLLKYLIPKNKNPYIKLHLDEIGSSIWLLIDSKIRVSEICNSLKINYGESLIEVEERVTKYFSKLYNEGFITFKELEI